MPKEDLEKLKANPEDGTATISNLLLEALAISKLNGSHKGLILFLWRKTYGWTKDKNNPKIKYKKAKISMAEWAAAIDSSRSYASKLINELVERNIIVRSDYKPGVAATYEINTTVTEWDNCYINIEQLYKNRTELLYNRGTALLYKRVTVHTSREPSGREEKGGVNEVLNELNKEEEEEGNSFKKIVDNYFKVFGEIPSTHNTEMIESYLKDGMEPEVINLALNEAGENNAKSFKYVKSILNDWIKKKVNTPEEALKVIAAHKKNKTTKSKQRTNPTENMTPEEVDAYYKARGYR